MNEQYLAIIIIGVLTHYMFLKLKSFFKISQIAPPTETQLTTVTPAQKKYNELMLNYYQDRATRQVAKTISHHNPKNRFSVKETALAIQNFNDLYPHIQIELREYNGVYSAGLVL